jgi:hypothetical protein
VEEVVDWLSAPDFLNDFTAYACRSFERESFDMGQRSAANVHAMKLRTNHIVFAIAPLALFAYASLAATDQDHARSVKALGSDRGGAQPPIQITVTTPKRDAEEEKAERERAARQDGTNQEIADASTSMAQMTRWLVVVSVLNVAVIVVGLIFTAKSARAAAVSAESASDSVKLARSSAAISLAQKRLGDRQTRLMELPYQQWLHVSRFSCDYQPHIGTIGEIVSGAQHTKFYRLRFRISNNTPLPFALERIEIGIAISEIGIHERGSIEHWDRRTVGPESRWNEEILIGVLDASDATKSIWENYINPYGVSVVGRVHYINALGRQSVREFARHAKRGEESKSFTLQEFQGDPAYEFSSMDEALAKARESQRSKQTGQGN